MTPAELKRARERLKLNQRELAEALGMQRNSVVRMENGMQPILRTTELSVRYLLVMSTKKKGGKKRGN
jgi:DNA-binding XRE family transcriptional regulator